MTAVPSPRCEACKRPLHRPSASGFGPVCERRRNARPTPVPAARTPTTATGPPIPGQLAFELSTAGHPVLCEDVFWGRRRPIDRAVHTVPTNGLL